MSVSRIVRAAAIAAILAVNAEAFAGNRVMEKKIEIEVCNLGTIRNVSLNFDHEKGTVSGTFQRAWGYTATSGAHVDIDLIDTQGKLLAEKTADTTGLFGCGVRRGFGGRSYFSAEFGPEFQKAAVVRICTQSERHGKHPSCGDEAISHFQ